MQYTRTCQWPQCGKEFTTVDSRQKYCARECQRKACAARESERLRRDTVERQERKHLLSKPWGLTHDPFTSGRFADGLPGLHAQVCPMG